MKPMWTSNPYLSHLIRNDQAAKTSTAHTTSKISAKSQLAEAQTKEEVVIIIRNALIPKLCALYQLEPERLAKEDLMNMYWSGMGTDSLMAVEIRSWFMKTLQVNIPVLKILGGSTVGEVLSIAADIIPPFLIPNIPFNDSNPSSVLEPLGSGSSLTETESNTDQGSGDQCNRLESSISSVSGASSSMQDVPLLPQALYKKTGLSFSQSMFWFMSNFLEDKASLNHTVSFRLTGRFRVEKLETAIKLTAQQHESLRTCIFEQGHEPIQGVMETPAIRGEFRSIQHENQVLQAVQEVHGHLYNLSQGKTMRILLLTLSPTIHFLVVGTHSLVMDGTSLQVFLKDLQQHYLYGHNIGTPTLQFLDYSNQQHVEISSQGFDDQLTYWKARLTPLPPPLPILRLSRVTSQSAVRAYENMRMDTRIGSETKTRIQSLCRRYGVTPFHFYLAAFRALLVRYTDAEDISIGIGDANRASDHMMNSIGVFVNLLPLRFQTKGTQSFGDVLEETRLDPPRSATHTPIFQCFVDYRSGLRKTSTWADCQLELVSFHASTLAYDIALDIIDDPDDDCLAMLILRKDLYNKHDAECLVYSYQKLVEHFSWYPEITLSEPVIFDSRDTQRALDFSKGHSLLSQWPETVSHRIEDVARTYYNDCAVRCIDGTTSTYGDLTCYESVIASALINAGCTPGTRIAVLQEPTPHWISSLMAIMRVGAVYVPLDLGNPESRLIAMTQDCRPTIVLIDEDTRQQVHGLGSSEWTIIDVSSLEMRKPNTTPIIATGQGAAAVLYTSGSSGIPKGIILQHEGLRNWLEFAPQIHDLKREVILQQSSSSFDMSLIQILTSLCFGGLLCLIPRRLRGDAEAITKVICTEGITYTFCCTSELRAWLKYGNPELLALSSWRRAITGGEPGVATLLRSLASLHKGDLRLFHAYGPTETTFTATVMELPYKNCDSEAFRDNVPVGRPLPNYSVYVLDDNMNPVPPEVQGEIYVGGPGVAAGYLNNDELTMERFVTNKYATTVDMTNGWTMLHRTGDLGRWRDDGMIFIEGRVAGDTQIKLRGLRIDLREVESALVKASKFTLEGAVVSVRRLSPESPEFLVAHVVFNPAYPATRYTEVLELLPSQLDLPRYMIPAAILPLDRLPLTNSLKIDRRAISLLGLPEIATSPHSAILTKTEASLANVWNAVIHSQGSKLQNVGPATDFFHIGGTSLSLLSLRARIQDLFGVELRLIDMFDNSTLTSMAQKIEAGNHTRPAVKVDWETCTRLSPTLINQATTCCGITRGRPRVIVLTGATGYLGQALLNALIREPEVKKVHCIAIRNASKRSGMFGHPKVITHEGDLALPRLGLSERVACEIFSAADLVIHNGADVSYIKPFSSLRAPNLESTRELVGMCLPRLIPFHYISSGGACGFAAAAGQEKICPESVARSPPPSTNPPGYAASKWASEVFLEKLSAHHINWPVWIHRPSNITRTDIAEFDLVSNFRYYSRLLRAVPVVRTNIDGWLDMVPLDIVVKGLMDAFHYTGEVDEDKTEERSGLRFLHHLGGVSLSFEDLRTWAGGGHGPEEACGNGSLETVAEISLEEWASRAGSQGMHETVVVFLQTFAARGSMKFPNLVSKCSKGSLDSDR
ncbi:NRPS [Diatrype stigma]|uniref:NRPS n=1 Tax=Diatrype stigma TaxID=117547 RepID=A0AAN9V1G4_9PEZI